MEYLINLLNTFLSIIFIIFIYRCIKGQIWISKRSIPGNIVTLEDHLLYLRLIKAYEHLSNKLLKKEYNSFSNINILDVGCGLGYGSAILASKLNININALDAEVGVIKKTKTIIDQAKEQYGNLCNFMQGTIEDMIKEGKKYDIVVSFQTIEHIIDDVAFIEKINRKLLTDRGILYLTTSNRKHRLKKNQKPWNPDHIREYDYKDLKIVLSKFFNIVNFYGLYAPPWAMNIELNRIKGSKLKKDIRRIIHTIKGFNKCNYNPDIFYIKHETQINIEECLDFFVECKK